MEKKILIRACLCGDKCRYNGSDVKNDLKFDDKEVLKICPELLGGLGIPRESCEIVDGSAEDVINRTAKIIGISGKDYTNEYLEGMEKAIELVKKHKIEIAYLKQNSPSCGYGKVYDGKFRGKIIEGNGIFAERLKKLGIKIIGI